MLKVSNNKHYSLTDILKAFLPQTILILLVLVFFYKVSFQCENFFYRDIFSHSFPSKQLLVNSVQTGEFPFWNIYSGIGMPYLADLSNQALYFFNILFFIFSAANAINFYIILHYLLAAIFMYLLANLIFDNKYIAVFTAIVFSFSGYCLSLSANMEYISAIVWLPAALWTWFQYYNKKKGLYLSLTSVFLSMFIYAGEPMAFFLPFC